MTAIDVNATIDGDPDAPPVVLSPSLGTSIAMWDPIVAALAERFRVIRYDPRGHGLSPVPPGPYEIDDLADDLLTLLDRLGIDAAHIVGISIGGMTAMAFAAAHPDRVDRLVLACTSPHLGPAQQWADRAFAVREGGTVAVADAVVARWLTPAYVAAHPEVLSGLRDQLVHTPADGYAACCRAIERMDLRDRLPSITAPTLVIAGAQDAATPREHAERIVAGMSNASLAVLDPAAHLAPVEQPATFADLVVSHLSKDAS